MITRTFLFFALIAMASCSQPSYDANEQLTADEQLALIEKIIHYHGKMPDKATLKTRTDTVFAAHYAKQVGKYSLVKYHRDQNRVYFATIRIAPSIKEKYVATAGYFSFDGEVLNEYQEVFRTWKMEKHELMPKLDMLFHRMVTGKDLSSYYPENSGDEEYIEFPNSEVFYNSELRIWESTREDVLKPYYNLIDEM